MTECSVLVAGVGGASLGTEILKCLRDAGGYRVFGCDISAIAFGHYQGDCEKTFVVDRATYVDEVLCHCEELGIRAIIPGGEEPLQLLSDAASTLTARKVLLISNAPNVVALCTDKARLFDRLTELGIPVPWSVEFDSSDSVADVSLPCVVKPATGSGGSRCTFLASTAGEVSMYVDHLLAVGCRPVVQEYVPETEGEFTVGVLTLPDGKLVCSVAMRRLFHTQLSVSARSEFGLISSGYSQGLIDDFPVVRAQAERIAGAIGSIGPLNIQGRLSNGRFLPFEINPRFSASTYLRALAGFNEVDVYLQWVLDEVPPAPVELRYGYYLRSLTEVHIPKGTVTR